MGGLALAITLLLASSAMAEIRFSGEGIALPTGFQMFLPTFNSIVTLPTNTTITRSFPQIRDFSGYNSSSLYNGEMSSITTINMSNITITGKGSIPLR